MALAGGPLAAALLTEGRLANAGVRILFLLAVSAAVAAAAFLALRRADTRGGREADARERSLRQARDQQAATAEILGAIAASTSDLQRVLDTIARNAARVCDGLYGQVYRSDGKEIRLAAHHGLSPARIEALGRHFPRSLDAEGLSARAIRDASVVHCPDMLTDPRVPEFAREIARAEGFRSVVVVPMLQDGRALGTLNVTRPEGGFTERQIQLLRSFAAQAVIAIENVRLFQELEARNRELTEALEQQTATGAILRVISGSPTDIQPVLDAMAESAMRLCDARDVSIALVDQGVLKVVASHGPMDRWWPDEGIPISRGSVTGRAVVDRRTIHIHDLASESDQEFPEGKAYQRQGGHRSNMAVPLLREGVAIGVIATRRGEVRPFTERQIRLLETFADQAVIAIENVRLFQELQARNRELTELLEQQTATAEILSVISRSPTDLQPVLDAVAQNASRLCGAANVSLYRVEGHLMRKVAEQGPPLTALRVGETRPIRRTTVSGRAIVDRTTIHVPDHQSAEAVREYPDARRDTGIRTTIGIPLLREGTAVGAFSAYRTESRPFSEREIALLQTFADQAVIAIENVRLFQELETRNRELTESLEQQTATAEILRVISSSPTDTQPVFDTIVQSAMRLCDGQSGALFRLVDGVIHQLAHANPVEGAHAVFRAAYPRPLDQAEPLARRQFAEATTLHVVDAETDPGLTEEFRARARTSGYRSLVAVPMLREGQVIGSMTVARAGPGRTPRAFSDREIGLLQTFAAQAVIAIENVRLFQELEARNRELTESLEQQTATAEILRAISASPTDLQPVFDTIVASAARLCSGLFGAIYRLEGGLVDLAGSYNLPEELVERVRATFPMRPHRGLLAMRALLDGMVVQSPDLEADREYQLHDVSRSLGMRSLVGVPMLRDGAPIGAIAIGRSAVGSFPTSQVELLKTFAAQAVIAIENVRLFTELEARNRELTESLEQQTATSEILRAISSSPTDTQPVFDTIADSAVRLCEGRYCTVYRFDGELIHLAAHHNLGAEGREEMKRAYPMRPSAARSLTARAIESRTVVHSPDYESDREIDEAARQRARAIGYRTGIAVPMLRAGTPIGCITVTRSDAAGGPFPFVAKEVALLQTFADQAVIAIENVRLFTELEARNRDLTETLEQQTATSEILRAISASPTDTQPVFDTIAQRAVRVCGGSHCLVFRFDGTLVHVVAHFGQTPAALQELQQAYPLPLSAETMATRSIRDGAVVNNPDLLSDPSEAVRRIARTGGYRTGVLVPMLRSGRAVGAIGVGRSGPGGESRPYTDKEIALLQTFADQGVIAVENVRLFRELDARTGELARSVDELQALSEVGRAVSSTLDLPTVLATIVTRAVQLARTNGGGIYEYDEATEEFHLQASYRTEDELVEVLRARPVRLGEGATGQAALRRVPVEVVDTLEDQQYQVTPVLRSTLNRFGYRSILAVPLLLESRILGALTVWRREPGSLPPDTVKLLQTFATQSALAIQNARLFREIEAKSRELEVASRHKSQFLANMSHELRTPLNAILGYTELLVDGIYGELSPKAGDVMTRIDRSGKHLLGLINDVLDLSKIEAGQLELALADYSLTEIVNAVATQVEALAAEKGLTLQVAVAPDLPAGRGDERRLAQVLLNLVGNAIKFTEVGSVRVAAYRDGDAFVVSVADTGPGIAEVDRQRIFEEFQQADSSSTRKKGGTGLGLSIARRIVELHGGRLWVDSAVGRGSIFSFRVPVRVERQVARS